MRPLVLPGQPLEEDAHGNQPLALAAARAALRSLDGEIGSVNFNPDDPASIESAIAAMEAMIDCKLVGYEGNAFIADLANKMKAQYRAAILEEAAAARQKPAQKPS
jgi:hypothetical protein